MEYAKFVESLAKPLPTTEERLDHAIFGLIGEVGELVDAHKKNVIYNQHFNVDNFVEELGDLRFYMQMILNEKFIAVVRREEELNAMNRGELLKQCAIEVGALTYAKENRFLDLFQNSLDHLFGTWDALCELTAHSPEEIIDKNMEKLKKRYPNSTYSDEHAKERLDKQE